MRKSNYNFCCFFVTSTYLTANENKATIFPDIANHLSLSSSTLETWLAFVQIEVLNQARQSGYFREAVTRRQKQKKTPCYLACILYKKSSSLLRTIQMSQQVQSISFLHQATVQILVYSMADNLLNFLDNTFVLIWSKSC